MSATPHAAYVDWPPAAAAVHYQARAFCSAAEDLDCAFDQARPFVITDILSRCLRDGEGQPYEASEIWAWTLGERLCGLAAVMWAAQERSVRWVAQCRECEESLELELPFAGLGDNPRPRHFSWRPDDTGELQIDLPSGLHQRAWLRAGESVSSQRMPSHMATSLVRRIDGDEPPADWRLPGVWLDGLAAALSERDPETALTAASVCPGCGHRAEIEIDLESLLLARLQRLQQSLLEDIHRLACVYHWTEQELLRLPAWRRNYYLRRCRADGEALA